MEDGPDLPGASATLRRLRPDDAPAYRALMLQAYAEHPDAFTSSVAERAGVPLAWWAARLREGALATEIVLGALDQGLLLGVVGLRCNLIERTRHKALLFGMAVASGQRRLGLGRRLVEAACAEALARPGLRLLQLTVSEGNLPACRLYEACGFRPYGLEPMALLLDGQPIAKLHMWRPLAGAAGPAWEDRPGRTPAPELEPRSPR